MNILVLGNGFDLAHGLPTKYSDFMEFIRVIREVITKGNDKVDWGNLNCEIQVEIQTNISHGFNTIIDNKQYWLEWIGDNIWVDYFSKNKNYIKEGWIDFESEIANVIISLDEDRTKSDGKLIPLNSNMGSLSNQFLSEYYSAYSFAGQFVGSSNKSITFREIRNRLLGDLNKLIRTLQFYLLEYVEKTDINVISSDIMGISIDKVLSFNYTDTFAKIYGKGKQIEYDFIHGKADQHHSVEDNNLVLGIDEYLPEDRKNHEVDFIAFKKFYQRIHKQTGCLYKDWVEVIKQPKKTPTGSYFTTLIQNLYIFGHSLDITDKDVLKDLILNDNVQTTIFYFNKKVYGQQIANLVKVIGQDELIKRTGGPHKTITFKQQSSMSSVTL